MTAIMLRDSPGLLEQQTKPDIMMLDYYKPRGMRYIDEQLQELIQPLASMIYWDAVKCINSENIESGLEITIARNAITEDIAKKIHDNIVISYTSKLPKEDDLKLFGVAFCVHTPDHRELYVPEKYDGRAKKSNYGFYLQFARSTKKIWTTGLIPWYTFVRLGPANNMTQTAADTLVENAERYGLLNVLINPQQTEKNEEPPTVQPVIRRIPSATQTATNPNRESELFRMLQQSGQIL